MKRTLTIVLAVLALLLAIFSALILIYQRVNPAAPLEYTQHEYAAARTELAPGETLVYSPTLTIRAAGRIDILRSFWNADKGSDAVLCSGQPAPIIQISRNRPRGVLNNFRGGAVVSIPVPNLPPGHYLLLSSASGPGRGQSDYQVAFRVTKPC